MLKGRLLSILAFFLIGTASNLSAQGQFRGYQLFNNDVNKPSQNCLVVLNPAVLDLNYYNNALTGGGSLFFRHKNVFSVDAAINMAYIDRGDQDYDSDQPFGTSVTKNQRYLSTGLGGTYYFKSSDFIVKKEASKMGGNKGTYKRAFVIVEETRKLLYGARLGGTYHASYAESASGRMAMSGVSKLSFTSKEVIDFQDKLNFSTNMQSIILHAGVSRSIARDFEALIEGENSNMAAYTINTWYVDALFAPYIHYDDIYVGNIDNRTANGVTEPYKIDDDSKKNMFGFRAGFEHKNMLPFSWSYGIETGLRPGPSFAGQPSLYLTAKIGYGFGFKLGK